MPHCRATSRYTDEQAVRGSELGMVYPCAGPYSRYYLLSHESWFALRAHQAPPRVIKAGLHRSQRRPFIRTSTSPPVYGGLFFLVRPAGRTHLEVEVLYGPGKGNCYRESPER
jgi:hypothetical protein